MENFGILNLNQYVKCEPFGIEELTKALMKLFYSDTNILNDIFWPDERRSVYDKYWKIIKHDIENELRESYMQDIRAKEWTRRIVFPFDENRNRILRSFCRRYDAGTVY